MEPGLERAGMNKGMWYAGSETFLGWRRFGFLVVVIIGIGCWSVEFYMKPDRRRGDLRGSAHASNQEDEGIGLPGREVCSVWGSLSRNARDLISGDEEGRTCWRSEGAPGFVDLHDEDVWNNRGRGKDGEVRICSLQQGQADATIVGADVCRGQMAKDDLVVDSGGGRAGDSGSSSVLR